MQKEELQKKCLEKINKSKKLRVAASAMCMHGHLTPICRIVSSLRARGHDVVFFVYSNAVVKIQNCLKQLGVEGVEVRSVYECTFEECRD